MAKPVLSKKIREKMLNLFQTGKSSLEVFDSIYDEAISYVDSDLQLSKCIASIKGKVPTQSDIEIKKKSETITPPEPKAFDTSNYQDIINSLSKSMQEKEFERACHPIVLDILENYEKFDRIIDANKAEGFSNPPFDFLAFKNGLPHIIEFKGSLENYNYPQDTQKKRLKELCEKIDGLNVALLQVNLKKSQYRIFYDKEMNLLFDGKAISMEPVEKWIRKIISVA